MFLALTVFFLSVLQADHTNVDKNGLAIQGYDPVAYFDEGVVKGSSAYQSTFRGSIYYFSSSENKERFDANPEKYQPQFGGWCAYALGLGPEKVKINPETFKVVDGKLYLFYNFRGTNTLGPWNENENALMKEAEKNWKKITQ